MTGKEIIDKLKTGQHVFGTVVVSQSVNWPGILSSLGMDFVFLDTEHTAIDRQSLSINCHMYKHSGVVPLVRISSPDPYKASRVLDGGAIGVVAPYIERAEEIRQLVGAVKCRPLKGKRLEKHLNTKTPLEQELKSYLLHGNQGNIMIANIESVPAIEAIDEILDVEGLDGVLIGPHDLSCSLGIPEQYAYPLFLNSVQKIIAKARSKNIGAGVMVWDAVGFDQEIEWAKNGANIVTHSNDLSVFSSTMQSDFKRIKSELGLMSKNS